MSKHVATLTITDNEDGSTKIAVMFNPPLEEDHALKDVPNGYWIMRSIHENSIQPILDGQKNIADLIEDYLLNNHIEEVPLVPEDNDGPEEPVVVA